MKYRFAGIGALAIWVVLLISVVAAPMAVAAVQATIDRGTVYQGEPFTLTLSVDGPAGGMEPDLTPLKQDFRVLGSSTSQQVRIVNGQRSDKTLWLVQLEPKRRGRLQIPAIAIDGERTRPLLVTVAEVPEQVSDGSGHPIFLEVDVNPEGDRTYVQQQIRYRVRLFLEQPLLGGDLSEPSPKDAVVERLGEDQQYQIRRNGKEYQVIERNYAIFPEKSGELGIPPVRFSGRVRGPGAASHRAGNRPGSLMERFFGEDPFTNDPFFKNMPAFGSDIFSRDAGRPVTLRSKPVRINIEPRPADYVGRYWVPAAGLELRDSWTEHPPEFRAGEPVTRTITIEAKGLESSQIPRLDLAAPSGVRLYPEAPESENRTDGSWVFGQSRQSWTYVPSRAGDLEIPEINLTWWDTVAGQERAARLPAWKLKVLPGMDALPPAEVTPPATRKAQAADVVSPRPGSEATAITEWWQQRWGWLAGAGVLVLMMALLLRRRRSAASGRGDGGSGVREPGTPVRETPRRREVLTHLRRACQQGDTAGAAGALLQLGATRWPEEPPGSLGALAARLERGGELVQQLDRALYAREGGKWDAGALWQMFGQGLPGGAPTPVTSDEEPLEPLYPQRV